MRWWFGIVCAAASLGGAAHARSLGAQDSVGTSWERESENGNVKYRIEVVASGLHVPSGLSFLPDGRLLITERPIGRLSVLDLSTGAITPIEGVPPVHGLVDGGLMDVLVHPNYAKNGWIYLSYAIEVPGGKTTVVDRARIERAHLVERQRLFTARPVIDNSNEFGSRLLLDRGFLYVTLGQRETPPTAQDLGSDLGKIIRLTEDGKVPRSNPFVGRKGALPEIWSYGHRNPQGLVRNPTTGEIWEHEHGPKGGDEVNIVHPGRNYGWPVIGYGRNYDGTPVGEGITHHAGMEQPIYYYLPSIAPSGMIFYTGEAFPAWRGNIFIGALALRHLNRLVVEGGRVIHEERLLTDSNWRVRVVQQGPDGALYIGVDSGMILRLHPSGSR